MNSEWSPTSVGEFCPFVYGKGLPDRDRNQAGLVPVVSSAGIIAKHDKAYVNGAGIVIGRKGTIGSLTILEKPFWPIDTAFFIKDEPEKRDLYFTYYLLKSLGLERMNTDSAVPGLNRENAHKVEVLVPSLEVQKKVGRFARAYDQQIATLTQQNVALETIAQRLFRSWFVNFDPVRSKAAGKEPEAMSAELAALFPSDFELNGLVPIPKGWSLESLDTSISYLNGLALQKYPVLEGEAALPVLKIAQLKAGRTDTNILANRRMKPEFIVRDGDVIFSWSGSLEIRIWTGGEAALNQHLFKVFSQVHPSWFCFQSTLRHLRSFKEIAASKATTMGHIQRHHLSEAKLAVPPKELMQKCSQIFGPMQSLIVNNGRLVRELAELRNHLLPRLISGKLSIEDAERAIEMRVAVSE